MLMLAFNAWAGSHTAAVLYFDNQGNPELEPLKVGLAQMLLTDLQGTVEHVDFVERIRLQAVLDELELGHTGQVDSQRAAEVGKLVGAEWLVMGTYFALGDTLRVDARVVEVSTGRILHAAGLTDPAGDVLGTEQKLAVELRRALTVSAAGPRPTPTPRPKRPTRGEPEPTAASVPLAAAVDYGQGLMHLDRKQPDQARESFQRSLSKAPQLEAARKALESLEL